MVLIIRFINIRFVTKRAKYNRPLDVSVTVDRQRWHADFGGRSEPWSSSCRVTCAGTMSSASKHVTRAMDDHSEVSNVVFPPLMSTIDAYVDASSDIRYAQTVEKVEKASNKKKVGRKVVKKKASPQTQIQIDTQPHSLRQPEHQQAHSFDNLREHYHLRRYSASEREDYVFGSVSLESAPKGHHADLSGNRVVHVASPPLTDRRPVGNKVNFPPRSPARIIVQSPVTGAFAYGAAHLSPTDVRNPGVG
jgi:hypothetical protein